MAYSLKQKQKICKAINKKYSTGKYTIESCCKSEGIHEKTFRRWEVQLEGIRTKSDKSRTKCPEESPKKSREMSDSYKEAKESARLNRMDELREVAMTSLMYHLQIQEYEEKKQIGKWNSKTKKMEVERMEVVKRRKDPNATLTRFTLENTDPKNFKTKQVIEHEGDHPFMALLKAASAHNQKSK